MVHVTEKNIALAQKFGIYHALPSCRQHVQWYPLTALVLCSIPILSTLINILRFLSGVLSVIPVSAAPFAEAPSVSATWADGLQRLKSPNIESVSFNVGQNKECAFWTYCSNVYRVRKLKIRTRKMTQETEEGWSLLWKFPFRRTRSCSAFRCFFNVNVPPTLASNSKASTTMFCS